jgi:D-lactate dehydrogenase
MRIVAFEVEPWEHGCFDQVREDHDVKILSEPLGHENAQEHADADVVSTFIYSDLGRKVLKRLDGLQMIATRSTGYDHIAMDYCRERQVTVCNVPSYGTNTVAEHAFGLLLTLSHRLDQAIDRTRKGDFSPRGLQGFDLHGKTLGVIGAGDIGKAAIRIGKGFGMEVLAFDVAEDEKAARELGFRYVDMTDLLAQADVITLHVPGSPKTRHLIAADEFAKMKDGVVLINTARGRVVDIQALVRAIAKKKVAGAGLDVLPEEPVIREEAELLRSVYERQHDLEALLADHVLLRLRNVVVTPHSAFNTREAVHQILETTCENILAFAKGQPQNTVNTR